jgi:hypothetical protein
MKNWPTPQEYNEAIQTPQLCFSDPDLKKTKIALNAMGLPKSASGAFASVYKATNGTTSWAVRCFLTHRPEQSTRYKHISDFVLFDNLDATVDFHYLEEGVQVKGHWYPCLKMVWVDGPTLDQYIEANYKDSIKMTELLKSFHQMVGELEGAGIGHGDLQHGNIIVAANGLRLVDYDALFVPALTGLKSLEFGHPNYQHPQRTETDYNPDIDHFSCWLIHVSLLAIAIDPTLYRKLGGGDEALLFKRKDLEDPENSQVFNTLLAHESDHINSTARLLKRMLWAAPNAIPYLGAPAEVLDDLPKEKPHKVLAVSGANTSAGDPAVKPSANGTEEDIAWYQEAQVHGIATSDVFDLSSGYDAIAASSVERKAQRQNPATRLKHLTQGTFRAGVQARDRIKRMAEKLEQSTLPASWINRKYTEAYSKFARCEYDAASKVFLEVFKQLDEQRSGKTYFEIALSLGSALALSGNSSLAGNYFVVAYNYSRRQNTELFLPRAGLALALCKYEENKDAAWKFLDDNPRSLAFLSSVIHNDLSNPFIARSVTFKLLRDYAMRMISHEHFHADAFSDAFSDALDSASIVLFHIMKNDSHFNDESLIESLIHLAAQLQLVGKDDRAYELLFMIADNCQSFGFPQYAKTARFCGATLLNESHQDVALSILANLGHTTIEDLSMLATTSSAFIEPGSILRLLLRVSKAFDEIGSKVEAKDALKVACKVSIGCKSDFIELIVSALDLSDKETIANCLNYSYLAPHCEPELLESFIQVVGASTYSRVQATVVEYFIRQRETTKLANLLAALSNRSDCRAFAQIFMSINATASADAMNQLIPAADMIVDRLCRSLDGCRSPIPPGDFASFPWHQYTTTVTALDNFRLLFKSLNDDKRSMKLLMLLASDDYQEIVGHWFLQQVAVSNFDRYYGLHEDMADNNQLAALERLISQLVSRGHLTVVEGITKNLTLKNHLLMLIELSENLASKGNLDAFAQISKEIAKTAAIDELIKTIDNLIESNHEGTEFVVTLLKRMLEQHQTDKASRILKHLHEIEKLSLATGLANTLLNSDYNGSLFEELVRQKDYTTLGAMLSCISAEIKTDGLMVLHRTFKYGGMSDSSLLEICKQCFNDLGLRLEKLLQASPSLQASHEDGASKSELKQLDSILQGFHYSRIFIAKKKEIVLNHVLSGFEALVTESLNEKYNPLVAIWCLKLAQNKSQDLLNAVVLDFAMYKMDSTIAAIVDKLIKKGLSDQIYSCCNSLIINEKLDNALLIALQLARRHTFEARTITAQIVKHTNSPSALCHLLEECVDVNEKLADMMVRQLSINRIETLKAMAILLAGQGDDVALPMVLTQLVATDEKFIEFIMPLCQSLDPENIHTTASWLVETGMITLVNQHVQQLHSKGNAEKAEIWAKYLPESIG